MKCSCGEETEDKCDICGKPICEECHGTLEDEFHDKQFVCLSCFSCFWKSVDKNSNSAD